MQKLCVLAAASLLFFGLSSAAVGAPIEVTYGLAPGTGTASWDPSGSGGTAGAGNAGGQMVIVYTSGSTSIGGTLGTLASMRVVQITFITPGTFVQPIPGMGVGVGLLGVRTAGGVGNFGPAATYVPASHFGVGAPPFPINGLTAAIGFNPLGSITVLLSGAGTQTMLNGAVVAPWTITAIVGQEIGRAVVPEPGSGVLVLGSLAVLAYGVRRLRR
jgi:hypothetical protein